MPNFTAIQYVSYSFNPVASNDFEMRLLQPRLLFSQKHGWSWSVIDLMQTNSFNARLPECSQHEEKEQAFKEQLSHLAALLPTLQVHLVSCSAFLSSANKFEFLDLGYKSRQWKRQDKQQLKKCKLLQPPLEDPASLFPWCSWCVKEDHRWRSCPDVPPANWCGRCEEDGHNWAGCPYNQAQEEVPCSPRASGATPLPPAPPPSPPSQEIWDWLMHPEADLVHDLPIVINTLWRRDGERAQSSIRNTPRENEEPEMARGCALLTDCVGMAQQSTGNKSIPIVQIMTAVSHRVQSTAAAAGASVRLSSPASGKSSVFTGDSRGSIALASALLWVREANLQRVSHRATVNLLARNPPGCPQLTVHQRPLYSGRAPVGLPVSCPGAALSSYAVAPGRLHVRLINVHDSAGRRTLNFAVSSIPLWFQHHSSPAPLPPDCCEAAYINRSGGASRSPKKDCGKHSSPSGADEVSSEV
ncbi:RN207 protein, partial [Polyodon spathula]|nr:RN207 protein [Polyodon spathula]